MKIQTFILSAVAMTMVACGTDKAGTTPFETDTIKVEKKDKQAELLIKVDYPVKGNTILTNRIKEYIDEELGGIYTGDVTNTDSVVKFYSDKYYGIIANQYKEDAGATAEYGDTDMPPYSKSYEILKINETDKYVTYMSKTYAYMGGAHGVSTGIGTTFRKSDGRKFDTSMMRDIYSEEFRQIIKEGLKQYFSEAEGETVNDENLKGLLLTESSLDYLPLPQFPPYLTPQGVVFAYQQYEIAPYASGMPSFVVSYDKMKPYLTQSALKLIGETQESK